MPFLTLRLKMIFGTVVLILLVGGALGLLVRHELHKRFEDEVHKRGVSIARYLGEASEIPLITENKVSLQQLVNETRSKDRDLAYLYIVDPANSITVHTFQGSFPENLLHLSKSLSRQGLFVPFRFNQESMYEVSIPIQNGALGTVHVGIYESVVQNNIHGVMKNMLPFVILILGGGVVAALLFAAAITRPISQLINGVQTVKDGNFDTVLPITAHDEIGELAKAFNQMTEHLQRTTVSRLFMEKLINTMNDVLVVFSPEGRIQSVNRAFCTLFGYDASQIEGRSITDFEEDSPQRLMFETYQQQGGEKLRSIEGVCRTSYGEAVYVMFSLAVMNDDDGAPLAIICAAQDIREIRQAHETLQAKQQELQLFNQTLENMVASRTAELAITNEGLRSEVAARQRKEDQLRAARDVAESASRSKSEFLANMSHEMRTPLNSILGGSEYLQQATLQPEEKRCLEMIHQAGETLLMLVNDLIDLARIEAGQLELHLAEYNLADMLEAVQRMMLLAAHKKEVRFSLIMPPDLPHFVIGDGARLQQVLLNLLANAVKFTASGGSVTLSVRCESSSDKNINLDFMVNDTGIGIESDKLNMIFDSFAQADSSITRRFGGSGLGLSISKRLIEAMGGEIAVESLPGVGSTFRFTLQFELSGKAVSRREGTIAEPENVSEFPADDKIRSARILLVDDAIENRELIRLILSKQQIELDEAENGQKAVELFERFNFDLVLMDIQMPVMDGYTATRTIRGIEDRRGKSRTPIVALTAHAYDEDIRKCIEAGCDDHFAKPFKKKRLLSCIETYLKRG